MGEEPGKLGKLEKLEKLEWPTRRRPGGRRHVGWSAYSAPLEGACAADGWLGDLNARTKKDRRKEVGRDAASPILLFRSHCGRAGSDFMLIFRLENATKRRQDLLKCPMNLERSMRDNHATLLLLSSGIYEMIP